MKNEASIEQSKFFLRANIIKQTEISPGIFELILDAPQIAAAAKPGQFVDLYLNDPSRLLPRPISICDFSPGDGTLRLVYRVTEKSAVSIHPGSQADPDVPSGGRTAAGVSGTQILSRYREGDMIDIAGPLGSGFPLPEPDEEKDYCLVGGGIGIPPMIGLGKRIAQGGNHVIYVLGYRNDELFLAKEAAETGTLILSTDDGSAGVHGTVVDAINVYGFAPDAYYACGPKPMLRGLSALAAQQQVPAWISLEERMACGIGACLGCVCRTTHVDGHSHVKNARVCTEGPVFLSTEVVL